MKQPLYSRWHRYDKNNVKYIAKCDIDKHPEPMNEVGFTEWKRGTGPHAPEVLVKVVAGLKRACTGVPKSAETKEKMRQAKLGKKKSDAHREAMRLSHKLRRKAQTNGQHDNDLQKARN